MKKRKQFYLNDQATDKFACKAPFLFTTTPNIYEEEMEKERDKEWFTKMKRLEKKSKMLSERIKVYSHRQFIMTERMKELHVMLSRQKRKNLLNVKLKL